MTEQTVVGDPTSSEPLKFAYWVPNVSGGLVVSTVEQRTDIIAKYAAGESVSALARLYSVSRANVLSIVNPRELNTPA